jgi:tellurite methyltransferase
LNLTFVDSLIASHSLPYATQEQFPEVWQRIDTSLLPNGVAVFDIFGLDHSYNGRPDMSFYSREQIQNMLGGRYEILNVNEENSKRTISDGTTQQWHLLTFIVRKRSNISLPPARQGGNH